MLRGLRAVAEQGLAMPPPIVIRVASDDSQVVVDIFDRGGGIPFELQQKVWSYMYSTRRGTRGAIDRKDSEATPLAGFGVGLPLSRLYAEPLGSWVALGVCCARYIGGSLQLVSMPGSPEAGRNRLLRPNFGTSLGRAKHLVAGFRHAFLFLERSDSRKVPAVSLTHPTRTAGRHADLCELAPEAPLVGGASGPGEPEASGR